MPIKYLYIDDEQTRTLAPVLRLLNTPEIDIFHKQVYESFSAVIDDIKRNDYKGLIIDQQLNSVSEDGHKADYFGTTLAQQLRTEMVVGHITAIPLILLSNENVIVESYLPDDSSKDLFDFVIKKNELDNINKSTRAKKMLSSLVHVYDLARQFKKEPGIDLSNNELCTLFNIDLKSLDYMDTRFNDFIRSKANDTHSLVASLYSSLIQSAGMLVSETMLLTKLGIEKDSDNWNDIKGMLADYLYKGPFSDLKSRWWFSGVEEWWYNVSPENVLQSLTCTERVKILNEKFGLNLSSIQLSYPQGDQSEKLWVNCVVSDIPLDPYDALRIRDPDAKAWEHPKYIDLRAYLEEDYDTIRYKIHVDDKSKVKKLISRLKPNVND
ncbi:protein-PII uridylyltransferase [Pectobacterium brasiliense]|uniref:hypothetical protein n=1 Tax=Pectobacterium brasiliense TaxID=180957 RepID=UPI0019697E46|nr:hypothetical protein [Pectobacterium brasiliense]MBN3253126.1 protein-PII uridylyltransferase [Pectobacterium brasiliense]